MLVEDSQTLSLLRLFTLGFPGSLAGKDSTCNVGDLGLIPRLGRSLAEGNGYFPSMEFHGLYSPWGPKQLDMTERLSLSLQSVLNTKQVFAVIVIILISKFWE